MIALRRLVLLALVGGGCAIAFAPSTALGAPARPAQADAAAAYWTPARRAGATPREIVVDHRGLSYLRGRAGALRPYGHSSPYRLAASVPSGARVPLAKPGGSTTGDTQAPVVSGRNPASGATIGTAHTFSATVTDEPGGSGVRAVSFVVTYPDGRTGTFRASQVSASTWSVSLSGFTASDRWSWVVVAKDRAGNTSARDPFPFTVQVSDGAGGGTEGTITEAAWQVDGPVKKATGRILFQMPANSRKTKWNDYLCSGTVVTDTATSRSIVLTAAHCVYDDANKSFARNVLFIPNQAGTTGTRTDRDCANDPMGCWTARFGVVDGNWSGKSWPANIAWDYGYYVVDATGAHSGTATASESLETVAGALSQDFTARTGSPVTHAFGYSGSQDPSLRFCAEGLASTDAVNWWLASCGLTGGSSGGPWIEPLTGASDAVKTGPVISVNSWGYANQPGMAGPKFPGTSVACLFTAAQSREPDAGLTPPGAIVTVANPAGC